MTSNKNVSGKFTILQRVMLLDLQFYDLTTTNLLLAFKWIPPGQLLDVFM